MTLPESALTVLWLLSWHGGQPAAAPSGGRVFTFDTTACTVTCLATNRVPTGTLGLDSIQIERILRLPLTPADRAFPVGALAPVQQGTTSGVRTKSKPWWHAVVWGVIGAGSGFVAGGFAGEAIDKAAHPQSEGFKGALVGAFTGAALGAFLLARFGP